MQTESHSVWTSFHATLAQEGANPVFNQANPSAPAPGPTGGNTTTTTTPPAGPGQSPFGGIIMPMVIVMGAIILFSLFSNRKQEKRRRELLGSIKKYDKVVTIGGVIGTVVELRDDEVVLKVDEHSSTKVRFTRSSIQSVLRPPAESETVKGLEEVAESKSKGESVGAKN